jgi:lysophospholipase L1-like esterase
MNRRKFIQSSMCMSALLPLGFDLRQDMPDEPFVINAGAGGNTTADMLRRIDRDCLSHRPDLTLLMAGTNDMNSIKYIPLPQYEQNMKSIISKILEIKSKIILMTILPAYEPYLYTRHKKEFYQPQGYAARKREVNSLIKRLAGEYRLTFMDMHHIFETAGNIGVEPDSLIQNEANSNKTDGIHPTSEGYRVMAVALYETWHVYVRTAFRYAQTGIKPKRAGKYDFVVIGGGVAGMCAAVLAARPGLKVAIIHDRPVWGGNNRSEVRVHLGGRIALSEKKYIKTSYNRKNKCFCRRFIS